MYGVVGEAFGGVEESNFFCLEEHCENGFVLIKFYIAHDHCEQLHMLGSVSLLDKSVCGSFNVIDKGVYRRTSLRTASRMHKTPNVPESMVKLMQGKEEN